MVIEIVGPLLQEQEPGLRAHAVRVLGRQKSSSETVGALLRPLLSREGAPCAATLAALLELGDKGGLEAAQGWVAKSADPALLDASIRYLGELGGRTSVPALRILLTHERQNVPEALLRRAVDAVQRIGLRESDAKKPAEDLLVEVFKRHAVYSVRDRARLQLGPFQNEEALKSLEEQVLDAIKANEREGRRNNADLWIELAEYRVLFRQWAKAIDAVNSAQRDDDKKLRTASIETLRAAAHCGRGRFEEAAKYLRTLTAEERADVLARYPVFEAMARDPRYQSLFQPPR
jgi:tetratricopeptide (TPR) repeat protein